MLPHRLQPPRIPVNGQPPLQHHIVCGFVLFSSHGVVETSVLLIKVVLNNKFVLRQRVWMESVLQSEVVSLLTDPGTKIEDP